MKRIFIFISAALLGAVVFGWFRGREQLAVRNIASIERQQTELQARLEQEQTQQKLLQQGVLAQPTAPAMARAELFSPALREWLLAGQFGEIPPSLVPELRELLQLSGDTTSDFVLISKSTMQTLRPPSPGKNDKLSDSLCALLSIESHQRAQIQAALTSARTQFGEWARQNVQREEPGGETVVRYTLPAGEQFADSVTNRLLSSISDLIGAQRTSLFRTYAETWFQIEMGYLGGVTNTLAVLRQPGSEGQPALFYKLTREAPNSSMSEGPGEIHSQYFPPAWRNVFPGAWPEVAQREGLDLPEPAKVSK